MDQRRRFSAESTASLANAVDEMWYAASERVSWRRKFALSRTRFIHGVRGDLLNLHICPRLLTMRLASLSSLFLHAAG